MIIEEIIRLIAGSLVLLGVAFGFYYDPYWYILPIFVSLNLIQSSMTGFCLMEKILIRLGAKKA